MMEANIEIPSTQGQQITRESLPLYTELIDQEESEKVGRKERLQFLARQAQELNLGYE